LLLLTTRFPYGQGEEFLATELPYLTQAFSVILVPKTPVSESSDHRQLPAGVTVRPDIANGVFGGAQRTSRWLLRNPRASGQLLSQVLRGKDRRGLHPQYWDRLAAGIRFGDALADAFSGEPVDVAYSYWLLASALAGVVVRDRLIAKIAVSRAHGGDLYHERSAVGFLPGQAQMVAGLDRIYCISDHGASYLRQRYPEHSHKIEVSRLGVPPAPVRNQPSQDGRLHLVSCAYLTPVKRIHLLVEALAQCEIPVTWTHLGGGRLEDAIREQAGSLPDNIRWQITGPLSNAEILRFYQEHPVDLFVNVSASEGLPVSMMEAMSYGIPVAATDVGGVSELVQPEVNGFLWPADVTPRAIADTLADFHRLSTSRKQALREAAWQTWQNTVNADVQYPDFVNRLLTLAQV